MFIEAGYPPNLASKTFDFLLIRDELVSKNHKFVAVDETSFGRHGVVTYGYAPIGKRLNVQKKSPRLTTTSVVVVALVDTNGIISKTSKHGSFNTKAASYFPTSTPHDEIVVPLPALPVESIRNLKGNSEPPKPTAAARPRQSSMVATVSVHGSSMQMLVVGGKAARQSAGWPTPYHCDAAR